MAIVGLQSRLNARRSAAAASSTDGVRRTGRWIARLACLAWLRRKTTQSDGAMVASLRFDGRCSGVALRVGPLLAETLDADRPRNIGGRKHSG